MVAGTSGIGSVGANMNGKRKFYLSCGVILLSAGMVFAGRLEGAGWITLATMALGIYAGANVVDKKLGGSG